MDERQQDKFDDRIMREVGTGCAGAIVFWLVLVILMLCFASCKTVKYVPVPEIHTIESHHTDSVHQVDSIIYEKETTIMMLDSAAMAEYGIKLANAERAWLVKTKELEKELSRLSKIKSDTIHEVDSIPYPVEVEVIKEVKKPLRWWQKALQRTGGIALGLLFLWLGWRAWKLWKFFHP